MYARGTVRTITESQKDFHLSSTGCLFERNFPVKVTDGECLIKESAPGEVSITFPGEGPGKRRRRRGKDSAAGINLELARENRKCKRVGSDLVKPITVVRCCFSRGKTEPRTCSPARYAHSLLNPYSNYILTRNQPAAWQSDRIPSEGKIAAPRYHALFEIKLTTAAQVML